MKSGTDILMRKAADQIKRAGIESGEVH